MNYGSYSLLNPPVRVTDMKSKGIDTAMIQIIIGYKDNSTPN
jgi:hypothetical protein